MDICSITCITSSRLLPPPAVVRSKVSQAGS